MRILVDKEIPGIVATLTQLGECELYDSDTLSPDSLLGPEVLVVRSVLQVNRALLEHSTIKVVASVTSGIDHIDLQDCQELGITLYYAHGANARAVGQYALSALLQAAEITSLQPKTIGIIGVGYTGSALVQLLSPFALELILYDPYKDLQATVTDVIKSDVIVLMACLHDSEPWPSRNSITQDFLEQCKSNTIIINTARSELLSDQAINFLLASRDHYYITDVYKNEPNVATQIITKSLFATPHIAGYSLNAKAQLNTLVLRQLFNHYKTEPLTDQLTETKTATSNLPSNIFYSSDNIMFTKQYLSFTSLHATMLALCHQSNHATVSIKEVRKSYPLRDEW
ncbi:MAG: NAD(P)-dependent oxidoreductase [Methylacidiphilales bacterium]|nr:NAD(P)-dependent oxidoreductase [Candidatus Methylacidiphilales bacterium]